MKYIKFLLMGEAGVGKSTLLGVYLWHLHSGNAFHDHRIDNRRYRIDVEEILTFNELRTHHIYQNQQEFLINMLCFDVTDRRTLQNLRKEWIPELLALNRNMKIFIVGLQCDLREQFLTKLTQNCVSHADGLSTCLYYENVYYLECSSLKLASVNDVFEQALEIFFYGNLEKEMEERILRLYAEMDIKFEFYGKIKWNDDYKGPRGESEGNDDDTDDDEEDKDVDETDNAGKHIDERAEDADDESDESDDLDEDTNESETKISLWHIQRVDEEPEKEIYEEHYTEPVDIWTETYESLVHDNVDDAEQSDNNIL